VTDEQGRSIDDTHARFRVNGGDEQDCDEVSEGGFVCGWEVYGTIDIFVSATGFADAERSVVVATDECHVIAQQVEIQLEAATAAFDEARVYISEVFDSQEECDQALTQGLNCLRVLEVCSDGEAVVMLTDIVTPGQCQLDSGVLSCQWHNGDAPDTMQFNYDVSNDELTDQSFDYVWRRGADDSGFDLCAQ
jgi:hypothetical protein